jgi:hypothetical protein
MTRQLRLAAPALLIWIPLSLGTSAQEPNQELERPATATAAVIPQQVRYAGKLANRVNGPVEAEFRIYAAAEGGEPLWTETQRIAVSEDGSYSVLLGSATAAGLPQSVFAGGAARWLGISADRAQEQERVLLSSVPYAMKSADAESLGGHAASDFVTQEQLAALAQESLPASAAASASTDQGAPTLFRGLTSGPLTGSGTANTIPLWTGTYTQGNSVMTQNSGTVDVQGPLAMPSVSQATTSNGQQSEPIQMNASAWNTVDAGPDNQTYSWVVGPNGNNTATPSGTLYLQYQSGTGPKTNILRFLDTGQIAFAASQTFPGTLASVTGMGSINASTSAGAVTVALNVPTLELQLNGLYPRLSVANSFTGNQSITGGLTITGALSTGSSLVTGLSSSNGGFLSNGALTVKPAGVATTSAAINSPLFELGASAYSSSSSAAVAQSFAWQTDATGNNTASPSANLALLFGSGASAPTATGLSIAHNGIISFAAGQTFPGGGGGGTISGITTTSPLTGSGTSGSVALGLNTSALETTLNAVYPQLGAANNFTGTQTITSGNLVLPATTGANSGVVTIGGIPFLHGYSSGNQNVFVGGAGNLTATGILASAIGNQALASLSSGKFNTAAGGLALFNDTTGAQNTAFGLQALYANTTGINNTAIGFNSGNSEAAYSGLSNSTAVGANSAVSQNNSLVLGQTDAINPGQLFVNVGIGTPTPRSIFEVAANATSALGPVITLTNPAGGAGAEAAIDFNTSTPGTNGFYNPGARILAVDDGSFSDDLFFFSNKPGGDNNGLALNMVVASNGQVGIGTSVPCCNGQLVVQSANENYYGAIEALGETSANGNGVGGIDATGGDSSGSAVAGTGGSFTGGSNAENGTAGDGIEAFVGQGGATAGLAGFFSGDVLVGGQFEAESKNFKIDHPSDPANKYLVHSSVESSERMNIYTGNAVTNELGIAVVDLPQWFEVLNTDFRYQLTVIGRKAQAWVSQEVQNGRFIISSDATFTKISWQITGVRQDPYAKAHPLVVEQEKNARERGFYIEPALYGQPEEKQTEWGRHPEIMRGRKADREAAKNKSTSGNPTFASDQPASAVNRRVAPGPASVARPTGACVVGAKVACPKAAK